MLTVTPRHVRINQSPVANPTGSVHFSGNHSHSTNPSATDAFEKSKSNPDAGHNKPGVTVWGAGNLGYATLADLLFQNQKANLDIDVRLVVPRRSERGQAQWDALKKAGYINLNDTLTQQSTRIPLDSKQIMGEWESDKLASALKNSQTVFITLPDLPVARKKVLKTLLSADLKGKTIILAPGGEGGVLKAARLLSKRHAQDVTIGLMETGPYGSRIAGTELASKRKGTIKVASFPAQNSGKLLQTLDRLFPLRYDNGQKVSNFKPVSPVEIILSGQNYIYHVAVVLDSANIARGKAYKHYWEGITPQVARKMEALDKERIAIGKAFGLKLEPLNEALNNHYGIGLYDSYYEAFKACRKIYSSRVPEPDKLSHHRYVMEDLPGISVIERLGQIAGVPTPVTTELKRTATENALRIGTQAHEIRGYRKAMAAMPETLKELKRYFADPANWAEGTSACSSQNTLPARFIRWIKEDILAKTFQWLGRVFRNFGKFFGVKS